MLAFAAKFMDAVRTRTKTQLATLSRTSKAIYVRDYEFDKEGQYSMEDIQKLRQYFETSEWSSIVRDHDKKERGDDGRDGQAGQRRHPRHVHLVG